MTDIIKIHTHATHITLPKVIGFLLSGLFPRFKIFTTTSKTSKKLITIYFNKVATADFNGLLVDFYYKV